MKRSPYKFDPVEYEKRQAERAAAKAEHGQGGGIVKANERIDRLEVLAGIVPPAK